LDEAWKHAWKTDTTSVFGGIVAFNREVTEETAKELSRLFIEVIIAPGFSGAALELLERKRNIRLLEFPDLFPKSIAENREGSLAYRSILGGLLVQDRDTKKIDPSEWKTVTKKKPTKRDLDAMVFAVKCVRHLKSNAVVFVKGTRTVAIGEGQTSRVDASLTAIGKGKKKIKGSVMASDGFFPFRDAVEVAAEAGVRALVQPGGSIRDKKVIGAANEYNIKMVFTGQRYFRH
jgi:phosphoribosylaminoimidazolecarboxamide formyltransferase/IMP cyclohydrolase